MATVRLGSGLLAMVLAMTISLTLAAGSTRAGSAAGIDRDVDAALTYMYASVPNSRPLANHAKAVLLQGSKISRMSK